LRYIPKKTPNFNNIEKILSKSTSLNQFSNNGPAVSELELLLHKLLKIDSSKRVLCTSNGTHAVHALMYFYNRKKWAIPSFNFPSAAISNSFDVDILDINLNDGGIESRGNLLDKYDGFILTNLFGTYVDIAFWESFCTKNNKILIFDNASCPLSVINKKNICNFGNASFGSLHHTKPLGFGEGGFIVVDSKDYLELKRVLNFGFNKERKYSRGSSNFKMSDVSAAFIIDNIEQYNIKKHIQNQEYIVNNLKKFSKVKVFNYKPGTVYGNLPIIYNKDINISDFDNFDIEVHKYYRPLKSLKNSNNLYSRIINFPLHHNLSTDNLNYIVNVIGNTS